jgi:hypothetical protein
MCKYTYRHTEIKTYRHTQTNWQTGSAEVTEGRQTKQTDVQKCSNILYIPTVHYMYIETDRLDRQNRPTQKDKQTDRQINRQYMCAVQEDSGRNIKN